MPIKHAFTNPKSDGGDATITRPSDWNAVHVASESWETAMAAVDGGNLVHRWKFEEASGNFADSEGSLTLTAAGSPTYQITTPLGYGATVTSAQTAASTGNMPSGSSDRTLIAVFKSGVTNLHMTIAAWGATGTTRQWQDCCLNHDDIAQGPCYLAWSDDHKPAGFVADNHWHMAAWRSRDRSGEVWLDGAVHSARQWGAVLATGTSYAMRVGGASAGLSVADVSAFNHWMPNVDLRRLWDTIKDSMDV